MDDRWYYAEARDRSYGPITIEELGRALRTKTNAANFLVWCPGMPDWARAGDQFALRQYFEPPPIPPHPAPEAAGQPVQQAMDRGELSQFEPGKSKVYPWRRYFARMFDLYVFSLFFFFFLGVAFPKLFENSDRRLDALYGIFGTAVYAVFEGFWTNVFGASLGKRLYGMRLLRTSDDGFSLGVAFQRSFAVWAKGLGIGIPIVSLFTLIVAYWNLTGDGQTTWDRDLKCAVTHGRLSALRWIFIVFMWLLLVAVYAGLTALGNAKS